MDRVYFKTKESKGKVHVQYKNLRKKVISPKKVANTLKKVVYAPYLITFVDYIIKHENTMKVNYRDMNENARKLSACQERGVKPEWAGLLFPASMRYTPGIGINIIQNGSLGINLYPGNNYTNTTKIRRSKLNNNIFTISKEEYTVSDAIAVIDKCMNGDSENEQMISDDSHGNIGNIGNIGNTGKTGNGSTGDIGNTETTLRLTQHDLVVCTELSLQLCSSRSKTLSDALYGPVTNKQHVRPILWTPVPAVRTAPTYRSSSLSWSAARLSGGELVMARNPQGRQRSATSTWMRLRPLAASLTSRGSKSWQPSISRLSFRTRHDTMHLKQGKTNNFTITQNPHTHGPPKLTETPPTMRQVTQNGLATMREGKGLEEEGLVLNLIGTRNTVRLAGEWKYHLPKKGLTINTGQYG